MQIDLVFVLKWVKNVTGCLLYILNLSAFLTIEPSSWSTLE